MTITIFLIPYMLFLVAWTFLSVFAIYHLVEFGVQNFTTYIATFLYIATSIIILFLSFTTLMQVNWATPLLQGFSIGLPQ